MKKKLLAMVMTLAMVLSLVPVTALAEEENPNPQTTETQTTPQAGGDGNQAGVTEEENQPSNDSTDPDKDKGDGGQSSDKDNGSQPSGDSTGSDQTGGESGDGSGGSGSDQPEQPAAYAAKIERAGETKEYDTLMDAIADAADGETVVMARNNTENISINKSLTLDLGGYTLTGTGEGAVVTISGAETKVVVQNGTVTGGNNSGNGGGFAIAKANVSLKNVTIKGNKAGGTGAGAIGGGGIYAEDAEVSLQEVTISDNEITKEYNDGGGILVKNGQLIMNKCKVIDNVSQDQGGGIQVVNTILQLENSEVKNNQAQQGGGIFVDDSGKTERNIHNIMSTDIIGNEASNIGGGMYVGTYSCMTLKNSTLKKNLCIGDSGQGGAIVAYSAAKLDLIGVTVTENEAASGAGIFALTTAMQPESVIRLTEETHVDGNKATGYGGGIYGYTLSGESAVSITMEDSSVSNNKAHSGAGMFTYAVEKSAVKVEIQSGGMVCGNAATAGYGGGIYAYSNTDITVAEGGALYNNTATTAADDIFSYGNSKLHLPDASKMAGERKLTADGKEITGWYHDGWYKWNPEAKEGAGGYEQIVRWAADANGKSYYDEYAPAEGSTYSASLKAAHDLLYQVKYVVTGDIPEVYTIPVEKTYTANSKYTIEKVPASISGTKDGVNGTYSFVGWKTEKGETLTGEQTLTGDVTLYGVWTFTKKSSGHRPSTPTIDIPDDDVPTGLNGADHYAYIIGYGNNDVRPQQSITRAEVATIFFRLLTDESREANMTKKQNYSDVKSNDWFCRAVATLSTMDIIKGYNDGSFQPNASITRAEFAAIAARFDPDGDTTPATFSDVGNHWAKDEISIAANHGWINGYEDGTFRPNQKITRAEAVTLINRVLNRLPETKEDLHKDMKTWIDNMDENAWYYLAIQEATNSHYNKNKEGTKYETWTDLRESRDWSELEK